MLFSFLLVLGPVFAQTPIDSSVDSSFALDERVGGRLGIGAAIGAPAGVAAKFWLGGWSALQMSLGGDLGEHRSLALTADYVNSFHPIQSPDPSFEVPVYVGAGLKVDADLADSSRISIGPRGVFGVSLVVTDMPVDLYVEVAPTFYFLELDLESGSGGGPFYASWAVDGQIGAHYYF